MTMMTQMRQWSDWAVSQILPHRCIGCAALVSSPGFCTLCWPSLRFITAPHCECCGDPFEVPASPNSRCGICSAAPPPWQRARAIWRYDDASRRPVLALKYQDRTALATIAAPLLCRVGQQLLHAPGALLVPVPLHWSRLATRGFNQAALLADAVREISAVPVEKHLLRRARRTAPQQGLDRTQRQSNVRKAFVVPESAAPRLAGRAVILVDDVITTGATAAACAKVLLAAGAASVDVLTLARVVQPRPLPI
jgi:ComF family protein